MAWNRFCNFAALLLAIFLVACGSDDAEDGEEETPFADADSIEDLGICTVNRDGDTVHVHQNSTDYACAGENWIDISTLPGISDSVKRFVHPVEIPSVYDLGICTRKIEGEVKLDLETGLSYVCHFPQWQLMVPLSEMHHNLKDYDEGDSSEIGDYFKIETLYELGLCDSLNRNLRVLVLADSNYYICRTRGWQRDTSYRDYLVVDDRQNLPLCDAGNARQRAFLKKDSVFFACDSMLWVPETDEGYLVRNASITGAAQKGPFKFNSPLMLREMFLHCDSLFYTGREYVDEISSNKGDFVIPKVRMVYPYAELEVRGLWRNEISGEWSKDSMTLRVLTDLSERTDVNINLLTHLEYSRAVNLVNSGYSVPAAKKQADYEIMTAFGFATSVDYSEDLETFVDSSSIHYDANAALMAISLLFIGERTDGEVQAAIDAFASDMAEDGEWSDEVAKAEMADWAEGFDGAPVRVNVKSWNILDIPNFENYLTDFWNNTYGLGGCAEARYGTVIPNSNQLSRNYNVHYICKFGGWQKASDYEKDTYGWQNGAYGELKEGNVTGAYYVFENGAWAYAENENALGLCQPERMGEVCKVDGKYLICRSDRWERATVLEFDTYGWEAGTEGEVRPGSVNPGKHYVFENGAWREPANGIESNFGACVEKREGEIIDYGGGSFYICKSKVWITATPLEYDTYGWEAGTEGEVKPGSVNTDKFYVFENGAWREPANGIESKFGACVWSREGELVDYGDGNFYICKSFYWKSASVLEYDTYGWEAGTEGEVRPGRVNTDKYYVYEDGVWRISASTVENDLGACVTSREGEVGKSGSTYYICKSKAWEFATRLEYDTYGWTAGTEGEMRPGRVNTSQYYVFDGGVWRASGGSVENSLGACVAGSEGKVDKLESSYYICKSRAWVKASTLEYDTYGLVAEKEGEVKPGVVNTNKYYVYENGVWREISIYSIEYYLGGCVASREGEVGQSRNDFYVCKSNEWTEALPIEKGLGGCVASREGDVAVYDGAYYICKGKWNESSYIEEKLLENFGACVASREGEKVRYESSNYVCKLYWNRATAFEYNTYGWEAGTEGEVKAGNVSGFYIYKKGEWIIATVLEYDTYGWEVGTEGEVRCGRVNAGKYYVFENGAWRASANSIENDLGACVTSREGEVGKSGNTYYICKSRTWKTASKLEYDTYGWEAGTEGEVKSGNVNTSLYYVYENGAWRNSTSSIDVELGGCIISREGEVDKIANTYYICKSKVWVEAAALEYDTYGLTCSQDGRIVSGAVDSSNKYVCHLGEFYEATNDEIYLNLGCTSYTVNQTIIQEDESRKITWFCSNAWVWEVKERIFNYGTLTDYRNGLTQTYKTIKIGNQIWMAQNLNYDPGDVSGMGSYAWSGCYKDEADSCAKYGRLYTWEVAMDKAGCGFEENCYNSYKGTQGICPSGWHLPSLAEWQRLLEPMAPSENYYSIYWDYNGAGRMLKSTSGWKYDGNGNDTYGFSALPAGYGLSGNFYNAGNSAHFWSSSEDNSYNAVCMYLQYEDAYRHYCSKYLAYSVRCVQNSN